MKEKKTTQIKVRITESQKAQVESYCAASGLNISQFIRLAITEFLGGFRNE